MHNAAAAEHPQQCILTATLICSSHRGTALFETYCMIGQWNLDVQPLEHDTLSKDLERKPNT